MQIPLSIWCVFLADGRVLRALLRARGPAPAEEARHPGPRHQRLHVGPETAPGPAGHGQDPRQPPP